MSIRWLATYLGGSLLFFGMGYLGHRKADNARFGSSIEEVYTFVPNAYAIRVAALGYHTMFGDLLWVRSVLLFGEGTHSTDSPSHQLLIGMLRTVSVLDPHWRSPHFYGGGMLRVNGDIEASDEIYARGMAGIPDDPYFPFSIAMNAYLYRKDVERAAHYLHIAGQIPGAPGWYRAAAGGILDREGQTFTALRYLREQIEAAQDDEARAPLVRKYNRVLHDYLSEELTKLKVVYEAHFGEPLRAPEDLLRLPVDQVLNPYLAQAIQAGQLPPEPQGSHWILTESQEIMSKARDDDERTSNQSAEAQVLRQPWNPMPGVP